VQKIGCARKPDPYRERINLAWRRKDAVFPTNGGRAVPESRGYFVRVVVAGGKPAALVAGDGARFGRCETTAGGVATFVRECTFCNMQGGVLHLSIGGFFID
jgi:hypothetical protein